MIKRTRPYRKHLVIENGKTKLVSTINDRPIWDLLKEYVNSLPTNHIFSRKEMLNKIYTANMQCTENVTDKYRRLLTIVNVLKIVDRGKYKKLRNIPVHLTTTQLKKIANPNSWESWFMTIDYV